MRSLSQTIHMANQMSELENDVYVKGGWSTDCRLH